MRTQALVAALLMSGSSPALAAVQVDLTSYLNFDLRGYTQGGDYPTGSISIGGVAFQLSGFGGTDLGVVQTNHDVIDMTIAPVANARVAYTIINSGFGTAGAYNGFIRFTGSGGSSVSYDLTQGLNIRDHYFGSFNNVATGLYATQSYAQGGGVADEAPGRVHFDVQRFDLTGLNGEDLVSITFDGQNGVADQPFLAALTIDDLAGGVPEPASWAMMIAGFGMAGAAMRRRPRAAFA